MVQTKGVKKLGRHSEGHRDMWRRRPFPSPTISFFHRKEKVGYAMLISRMRVVGYFVDCADSASGRLIARDVLFLSPAGINRKLK